MWQPLKVLTKKGLCIKLCALWNTPPKSMKTKLTPPTVGPNGKSSDKMGVLVMLKF